MTNQTPSLPALTTHQPQYLVDAAGNRCGVVLEPEVYEQIMACLGDSELENSVLQIYSPKIVATPGICGGKPRLAGHRIRVEDIASWHEHQGMSVTEILEQFPSLTRAEVHTALAYYFEHQTEIEADLEADRRFAEAMAEQTPSLLAQKLAVQAAHRQAE